MGVRKRRIQNIIIELRPEEFVEKAFAKHGRLEAEPMVMDSGIAGMVYLFQDKEGNLYYLNRLFASLNEIDVGQEGQAEMYRKLTLMHAWRAA
ncbi:MAG: hypothetical protein LKE64_07875 [Solobacterium sp.]|nr:hypothetical protein [Solobacterium sp.]MCH4048849.1 hypothetical protein [Solobacterium sp.]MCH4074397.1 hypothetical protein [Solobacterium sp.]MCI1314355.1 hypothetical protein [Solobacterium sp.]MCI1346611.1 hypothetical protein [Solobacterium sp.]